MCVFKSKASATSGQRHKLCIFKPKQAKMAKTHLLRVGCAFYAKFSRVRPLFNEGPMDRLGQIRLLGAVPRQCASVAHLKDGCLVVGWGCTCTPRAKPSNVRPHDPPPHHCMPTQRADRNEGRSTPRRSHPYPPVYPNSLQVPRPTQQSWRSPLPQSSGPPWPPAWWPPLCPR